MIPTRRQDLVDDLHGVRAADPYRWLEDAAAPEVRDWMDAQDAYTRERLAAAPERDALLERCRELLYYEAISTPARRGGRLFYSRRARDAEKAIAYWRDGDDGDERVLLDPNTFSDDGSTALGVWVPSPDGRLVVYARRENNADEATLYVRDVDTGEDLPGERIEGGKYATPSWTPACDGFYYTWLTMDPGVPAAERPGHAELRFHRLGDDPARDAIVHPATGSARTFLGGGVSRDGRWLLVTIAHGWNATDVWFRAGDQPDAPLRPLATGQPFLYHALAWGDAIYVHTNEGAPRYRVFRVDPARPERDAWREIVAERDDLTIEGVQLVGGHLVVSGLRNAASVVELRTLDGALVRELALPGIGTVEGVAGEPDDDRAYYSYSSFLEPTAIYQTSIASGDTELWRRVQVPMDGSAFAVEQVWYPSRDGTRISMFVITPRDFTPAGDAPTILYGYGGFNVSLTPGFTPTLAVWLERGGVYAIPNLRGGGEYGEGWHDAGKGAHKQNTFDDFIAAAEYLIDRKYTRPERLAIRGGSNGGLLVGAAMTQRPELFAAVVCAVPLLDMLRYHLFGSGETWTPEYGSPEDPEQVRWLAAYSPYHKVVDGTPYPAMLMLAAHDDDRVDPMHARKFTAAIQHATTSERPVLLRIERQAGHGGADKVAQTVELSADTYAFLLQQLGP